MPNFPMSWSTLEALQRHVVGQRLERLNLLSPFVLRSVDPPIDSIQRPRPSTACGASASGSSWSSGDDDLFLVIHLMIAGRLRWRAPGQKPGMGPKLILASFSSPRHAVLHRASSKKRASIQLVRGEAALKALDPGRPRAARRHARQFHDALARENHTLKRSLTDPHLFSGIGNAYSDEILHAARLSPLKLTRDAVGRGSARLYDATRRRCAWIDHLRARGQGRFPEKVTAFRPEMAVHGRFKQPCPVCGAPVQHIVYADNECNYCAKCQTGGRLLADRSLSRRAQGRASAASLDELNQ